MATYVITHEVDDVQHWLNSPKRAEAFASVGATQREFIDPAGSNRIAIVAEIPDFAAFQAFLQSDEAAAAMQHDGVRPETIVVFEAGG